MPAGRAARGVMRACLWSLLLLASSPVSGMCRAPSGFLGQRFAFVGAVPCGGSSALRAVKGEWFCGIGMTFFRAGVLGTRVVKGNVHMCGNVLYIVLSVCISARYGASLLYFRIILFSITCILFWLDLLRGNDTSRISNELLFIFWAILMFCLILINLLVPDIFSDVVHDCSASL